VTGRRPELFADARDLLVAFGRFGVDYVIVGAHALAAHGIPRATVDFDVLVRPTSDNAKRAWAALADFGAPVVAHGLRVDDLERAGTVYQVGLPPRRIDVLTSVSGVEFDEAWATRLEFEIDGLMVASLGREALIKNKRASGRAKDLLDVRALEQEPR